MDMQQNPAVFGTEDILMRACDSVRSVLSVSTQCDIRFSGVVQRITKTCLKPDIGCFVLFDGAFSGLVIINFSAAAAMELYERYMLNMGIPRADLARAHTSDEVSNVMGELMNQAVGDFSEKVARELQTHITQNQPKMLVLNKQVILSVDTHLDQPEARRVTFYTGNNNIFFLELAVDGVELIKLFDFEPVAAADPDQVFSQAGQILSAPAPASEAGPDDTDELLKSLGM